MSRSVVSRAWYAGLRWLLRVLVGPMVSYRCYGLHWVPRTGGVLVLSNHQSNLDPVLVGMGCPRRLNYLARQTLFDHKLFSKLINSLDAIPIDRDGFGMAGLKETMRRLKREEMVLIFPEGTRTRDGEIAPLRPGFYTLAKRCPISLLPVAIDGAFESWPRGQKLPRRSTIAVQFGEPILPEEVAQLDEPALMALVEQRMRACHKLARHKRLHGDV